jgi:hypothetical protein
MADAFSCGDSIDSNDAQLFLESIYIPPSADGLVLLKN